jgi:hypothetical protein
MDKRITAYDSTGTSKFQTLVTTAAASTSTAITANRILLIGSLQAQFIRFGANPVASISTASFVLPANTTMMFNFTSGEKISAVSHTGTAYLTIVDMD